MSILKILREKLSSEDFAKVMDAVGDDFDWDVVPRSRLTKVIRQRNELRELLSEQPQAQAKGGSADADDDDDDRELTPPAKKGKSGAGDGAQQGGVSLEEIEARHQQELNALRVRYSAVDKLRAAGARDPELILNAGLIDLKQAKVTKEGSVIWPEGDADPFMALKSDESRSYLFNSDDGRAPRGTGKEGGAGSDDVVTIQEAWAAAQKSGDSRMQARLIREAYEKGIQLT